MRCFIAIELPETVREHLVKIQESLRTEFPKAGYPRLENLHITLKFLGEVEGRKLPNLIESMSLIRLGSVISAHAQEIECFPSRGPVRIIAAGFGGELAPLDALHRSIEQRAQHLGFEPEARKYRPHATLARARPVLPLSARTASTQLSALFPGPGFQITGFSIMQSQLSPKGSVYHAIHRIEFAA